MNEISIRQNSPTCLNLLAAASSVYGRAKGLAGIQFMLTVIIPVSVGVAAIIIPSLKAPLATYGLVVFLWDTFFLTQRHRELKRQGAGFQECFDCCVMEIPWNSWRAGKELGYRETVPEEAKRYLKTHDRNRIVNWYPEEVGQLPLAIARLACQRASLSWDDDLRQKYRRLIISGLFMIIIGLLGGALAMGLSFPDTMLTVFAPAFLSIQWAGRELQQQSLTITSLQRLREKADGLIDRACVGEIDQCRMDAEARELQDEIFTHRATSPIIPNWFYNRLRSQFDGRMEETVRNLIDKWNRSDARIVAVKRYNSENDFEEEANA